MPDTPGEGTLNLLGAEPVAHLRVDEYEEEWEIGKQEMPVEVQQRLKIIQRLLAAEGTKSYGAVQRRAARELGITVHRCSDW